jgi:uncharacterized protein
MYSKLVSRIKSAFFHAKLHSNCIDTSVLIRFRVANFRSIKEEQEISMVASPISEHPNATVHVERYDLDLLRTAAIYGPNASGKSTVIDALRFMHTAVMESQTKWNPAGGVPRVAFALDPAKLEEPSAFSIDFLVDHVRYEYGFVVDSSRVLEEWLFAYPKKKRQVWFTRDASQAEEFTFSRLLGGENRIISSFTRSNSLFISAAAQSNHPMLGSIYNFMRRLFTLDLSIRPAMELAVMQFCTDPLSKDAILAFLRSADLGVTEMDVEEEDVADFAKRYNQTVDDPEFLSAFGSRRAAAGVQLRHQSGGDRSISLPFDQESEGTRTMFSLAGFAIPVLKAGGILVVDELDRSLHPHLAKGVIKLFNSPTTNPNNAQLIFNTHDTNLLDTEILRRDQIWFTEKDDEGATKLYPLTDFRTRKHENLERGYLQGRYGAIPVIGAEGLLYKAVS